MIIQSQRCEECGGKNKRGIHYCSRLCMGRARNRRIERICRQCSAPFMVRRRNHGLYCSRACFHLSKRVIKHCQICDKDFMSRRSSNSAFCSRVCSVRRRSETSAGRLEAICSKVRLMELINRGLTSEEIHPILGISYSKLWQIVRRYDLKFPSVGRPRSQREFRDRDRFRCSKCSGIFPMSDAPPRRRKRAWYCRQCDNDRARELLRTQSGRLSVLVNVAMYRAKKRKIGFDIDKQFVETLWESQGHKCAYSGLEMTFESGKPNLVSLDRTDSSRGYTKDNVVLCCAAINRMKLDLSIADFRRWCQLVAGTSILGIHDEIDQLNP